MLVFGAAFSVATNSTPSALGKCVHSIAPQGAIERDHVFLHFLAKCFTTLTAQLLENLWEAFHWVELFGITSCIGSTELSLLFQVNSIFVILQRNFWVKNSTIGYACIIVEYTMHIAIDDEIAKSRMPRDPRRSCSEVRKQR